MLDGFAGTGIVGMYFQNKYPNLNIVANDLEYYSYIINFAQLCVPYSDKIKNKIIEINTKLKEHKNKKKYELISTNYSPKGENNRMFWSIINAEKGDYTKFLIDKNLKEDKITKNESIFLIASLLSSMDKLANTASVYGAYLKNFKKSALEELELKPIHLNESVNDNKVFNLNINSETILNQKYDIVYLDPPYNHRQYSCNYHPLNFIALYDKNIEIYGKTGLIKDSNKSKYCQKKEAYDELSNLITNLKSNHILLSYNNEGIIEFDKIKEILNSLGKVILYMKPYKKFKSNEKQENENVYEYLFHLEKSEKKSFKIEKVE
jgi:adenine-specific DNA-methyltransferase